MKLDTRSKLERVRHAVRRHRPVRRQHVDHLALFISVDQRVIQDARDDAFHQARDLLGVLRTQVIATRPGQLLATARWGTSRERLSQRRRRQRAQAEPHRAYYEPASAQRPEAWPDLPVVRWRV